METKTIFWIVIAAVALLAIAYLVLGGGTDAATAQAQLPQMVGGC